MSTLTEVRRPLTTVFVDLVGSTPLSIELDEEEYSGVLNEYRELTQRLAEDYGGFIPKDEGDGRFFWFGWPTARHDDAHRAVAMSSALLNEMRALSQRVQQMCGRDLQVRVGVHTGSAIVAARDVDFADVSGAAINFAAKVQAAAAPGAILVSEATEEMLSGRWQLESAGSVTIDSLEGEVEVKQVLGPTAGASSLGPLFGRAAELAALPPEPGAPVAVVGPAGLGKSRLIAELAGRCEHDILYVQAAERQADAPFSAILAALREREEGPVALLDPDSAIAGLTKRVLDLAGDDDLVLVFEDLHWLDPSSCELVDHLIDLAHPQLRIVLTGRWLPELVNVDAVKTFELQPLDAVKAAELVSTVAPDLDERGARELIDRAAGNPFFLTWLARAAGDRFEGVRRILRPRSGVPIVVQQAVRSQIDDAGVDDSITSTAAVIGLDFDQQLIGRVLDLPGAEVERNLDRLAGHGIVVPHGHGVYRFSHSLVHELAYDLMLGPERKTRHRQVADHVEQASPSDHTTIGFHRDHADQPGEAVHHKLAAAQQCRRTNAYREASELTRRCVELIDANPVATASNELAVRELHAVVSTTSRGGYTEHTSDRTGLLDMLDPERDAAKIALLKTRDWAAAMSIADLPTVQKLNYEVYRAARSSYPPIRPYNTNARAHYAALTGKAVHAERLFERSIELMLEEGLDPAIGQGWATVDDPIVLGMAHSLSTLVVRGRLTTARERLETAYRRAETLPGGGPTLAHLASIDATFRQSMGEAEEAKRAADQVTEVAEDLGLTMWAHQGRLHQSVADTMANPSQSNVHRLFGEAELIASIAAMAAPHLYELAGRLARQIGDHETAEQSLDRLEGLSATHGLKAFDVEVMRLRSADAEDVSGALEHAIAIGARRGTRRHALRAASDLVEREPSTAAMASLAALVADYPEPDGDPDAERARELLDR